MGMTGTEISSTLTTVKPSLTGSQSVAGRASQNANIENNYKLQTPEPKIQGLGHLGGNLDIRI